jgi:hypothetical protein
MYVTRVPRNVNLSSVNFCRAVEALPEPVAPAHCSRVAQFVSLRRKLGDPAGFLTQLFGKPEFE